jgi:peptide/nickel transport system substrate-binding protein
MSLSNVDAAGDGVTTRVVDEWAVGRRRRPIRPVWLALLAGVLLVAACGDSDSTGAVAEGAPTTGDATAASDEPSTGEVDREATFRFAYSINVSRLDPHRATIRNDLTTLGPIYDRLVEFSPDGELVGMLATDWSFADDATVLDLTLRQGVVFHDGEPFDAEAVKANIERGQTLEGSTVAGDLDIITEVEVVDDHHVRFHLAEPDVSILGLLSDRPGIMVSPAAFDEDLDAVAVGAGPFRLVQHRPDDVTVYERFDDYWDPDVALIRRLEIHVVADPVTRLNGLRTDEFDATTLIGNQYEEASGLPDITLQTDPTLFMISMGLNRTRSEFGDLRVRQALLHAVDREAICQAVVFGLCDVTSEPFPEGYWANNPDIAPDHYGHDPERSRQLLAEAGLPDGFSFSWMIPANLSPYNEVAEAMQAQMAEVGIDARLMVMEPAQMADRYYAQRETDAILGGLVGNADPSLYFGQYMMPDAYANPGGHSTDEIQRLYRESIAIADPDERTAVLHAAVQEVVDEVLAIPVMFPHTIAALRDGVVGYVTPVSANPQFRGVGIAAG